MSEKSFLRTFIGFFTDTTQNRLKKYKFTATASAVTLRDTKASFTLRQIVYSQLIAICLARPQCANGALTHHLLVYNFGYAVKN